MTTTIKVRFRPSGDGTEGEIYYQLSHGKKIKVMRTHYRVFTDEWNAKAQTVVMNKLNPRRNHILTLREKIQTDMDLFRKIIHNLEADNISFTCRDIAAKFEKYTSEYTLTNYMENIISQLHQNGKIRTSETYRATLNSFKKYYGRNSIRLDNITRELIEGYEGWLRHHGLTPNTISFYMRILRATYNRAVEENIIDNKSPFKHVYTGIDKTTKRAVHLSSIRKIYTLDLHHSPRLDFARDMFLMSFFLRGMSFVDMAFLRKTDLRNGYISYRRRKTGQQLHIKWTDEMQRILNKYPENETCYLLPLIRREGAGEIYAYRNMSYNINRCLKEIASMTGMELPLTMYVARHSWASAAKTNGIPISVISEGMGHDSESTTRIYLASLDTSVVDRANSVILKSLKLDSTQNQAKHTFVKS